MNTPIHNQDANELRRFLSFIQMNGIKRYCEIGCENGITFRHIMTMLGKDAWGVAIDLPRNDRAQNNLETAIDYLCDCGHKSVFVYFGDSQVAETIKLARQRGPFDLIFIDGDHTYPGVTRDFLVYRHMTKFMAFHDIAAPNGHLSDGLPNGVAEFWRKIKLGTDPQLPQEHKVIGEIINPGSNMGIGILEMLR